MDDKELRRHNQIKLTLKILGISLIVIGAIFTVIGIADFFSAMASEDMRMPTKFWCAFVGIPSIAIGSTLTALGYKQEIARYVKNESVDVINDLSQDIKPAISNVVSAVQESTQDNIVCECGEVNDANSKFCKNCGKALVKVCPYCNAENDADASFCNNCGKNIG